MKETKKKDSKKSVDIGTVLVVDPCADVRIEDVLKRVSETRKKNDKSKMKRRK